MNLVLNFSEAVRRYQPFTALNHLSRMKNFEDGFKKFVFKKAKLEADLGCSSFDEPGPNSFTRADVSEFDLDSYYNKLCKAFPTMMTPMIAVAASGRFEDGTIEVPSQSEIVT